MDGRTYGGTTAFVCVRVGCGACIQGMMLSLGAFGGHLGNSGAAAPVTKTLDGDSVQARNGGAYVCMGEQQPL